MNDPIRVTVCTLLLAVSNLSAATLYVSLGSTNPTPPYATWATAATNIQDAVDAAAAGDAVVVTNGTYATGSRVVLLLMGGTMTNRVAVDKPLALRSVDGPQATVIDGRSAVGCVYLTNGATLFGFTLINGVAECGGGVYCESTSAVLSNCVLIGNSAEFGGGAWGGTLNNCDLTGNWADFKMGGCGGAGSCTLYNCTLTGNSAGEAGGAGSCTLYNCTLTANVARGGGGASGCTLFNCTLSGNSAGQMPLFGAGGAWNCTLYNCIVYFNREGGDAAGSTLNYCCVTSISPTNGVGNITDDPLFVDYADGNLRLQPNSPCINAGNNAYAPAPVDLDGNPRIVGGTVDIGAYECQSPALLAYFTWLQSYSLPTYAGELYADSDSDGMNNWREWIAGTNPTNALSVLKMLAPASTNNPVGLVVTWESVDTRTYYLQRSTNLGAQPAFSTIQSHIVGQAGTTSYTDTTATNAGPHFYRVGVGN